MKRDYQKIDTLFKRDEKKVIIPSQYTCDEYKYLENCVFECSEKIDGTNIHIDMTGVDGDVIITYEGRTKDAETPKFLLDKLEELFPKEKLQKVFSSQWEDIRQGKCNVSVYGEGYGLKINKYGKQYNSKGCGFILFDVKIDEWWLNRESCEDIALKLGVDIVPIIGYMTILEAIEYVKKGFKSLVSEDPNLDAEGLILKTPMGLKFRNGKRIIAKLKDKDFKHYERIYGKL